MDFKKILGKFNSIEPITEGKKDTRNMPLTDVPGSGPEFTGYWKGTDKGMPGKKLVGDKHSKDQDEMFQLFTDPNKTNKDVDDAVDSIIKDLAKGKTPKTKTEELAEEYKEFNEEEFKDTMEKRARRKSDRHPRGHEPKAQYKTIEKSHKQKKEAKAVRDVHAEIAADRYNEEVNLDEAVKADLDDTLANTTDPRLRLDILRAMAKYKGRAGDNPLSALAIELSKNIERLDKENDEEASNIARLDKENDQEQVELAKQAKTDQRHNTEIASMQAQQQIDRPETPLAIETHPDNTSKKSLPLMGAPGEGPEFTGYWKGTDKGVPGKKMVGSKKPTWNKGSKPITEKDIEEGYKAIPEATLSAKAGRAGKDLGKPGKNFAKIAKSAGKKYGSKKAGERVAGAILAKMRKAEESIQSLKEAMFTPSYDYKGFKYEPYEEQYDDVSKIWHQVTSPKGVKVDMDWSPYDYPSEKQFQQWLHAGMPDRKALKDLGIGSGIGPIDGKELDMATSVKEELKKKPETVDQWVIFNKDKQSPYKGFNSKQDAYEYLIKVMDFDPQYSVLHSSEVDAGYPPSVPVVTEYGADNDGAPERVGDPVADTNLNKERQSIDRLKRLNPEIETNKAVSALANDAELSTMDKDSLAQVAKTLGPALKDQNVVNSIEQSFKRST